MLRSLYIRNYLLVSELRLKFDAGLTVLTGETGAGKSMIVGALDVLLGEKFPKDSVGNHGDRAIVEGIFQLGAASELTALLDEDDPSDEIILRREVGRQGKSRSFLNDRPVTADVLTTIRKLFVDFHGQREQNSLFDSLRQLDYLDSFAQSKNLAAKVRELYTARAAKSTQVAKLSNEIAAQSKERALLSYQLEEIERFGLKPGEESEIEARLVKLESAEKLTADSARLLDLLDESEPAMVTLAGQSKLAAQTIAKTDREFEPLAQELADIASRVKDIAGSVQRYAESLAVDEAELAQLRDRRGILWTLKRKHGVSVEQILERADELKLVLNHGEAREQELALRTEELNTLNTQLCNAALELSKQRTKSAPHLSKRIQSELSGLGFPNPQFEIHLDSAPTPVSGESVTEHGIDKTQFLFSANPGSKLAPLAQVASGGETSRVTLAIKSVLADAMSYPLLVYDEIDLGISGKTADSVGRALAALAENHQTLVITHLPQIAARADRHLCVLKTSDDSSSETTAKFLNQRERVDAIASLISGVHVTDKARASASELLRANGKLQAA